MNIHLTGVRNKSDIEILCALSEQLVRHYKILPHGMVQVTKTGYVVDILFTVISNKAIRRVKKHPSQVIHSTEDLLRHIKECTNHYLRLGQHGVKLRDWSRHHIYRQFIKVSKS